MRKITAILIVSELEWLVVLALEEREEERKELDRAPNTIFISN